MTINPVPAGELALLLNAAGAQRANGWALEAAPGKASSSMRGSAGGPFDVLDVVGVGFGPANIALAIALEEMWPSARVRFLEANPGPAWQPAMMLDGADIQNNPMRDLVTPRNPRSRYTFINYLHEQGRLFKYLNLPGHFPLRKEYAKYIEWVAEHVHADVHYGQKVVHIGLAEVNGERVIRVHTATGASYYGRSIVVAPGRTPYIPEVFGELSAPLVYHTSRYLHAVAGLPHHWSGSIAVVGASQSAAEVMLDLMNRVPAARIVNVMSSFGYRLKDTSPFSEEVYFPEFVNYYFNASAEGKERLRAQLRPTNYSAADRDVIDALYSRLYEQDLDGRRVVTLKTNRQITAAEARHGQVILSTREHITGATEQLTLDLVILATGYRDLGVQGRTEQLPPLLKDLADVLDVDNTTGLRVGFDYCAEPRSADSKLPPIFINGLCESTHGLGDAGSFSLLALRSQAIVQGLCRRLTDLTTELPTWVGESNADARTFSGR
jgi:L-ornithine N5-oxygenase